MRNLYGKMSIQSNPQERLIRRLLKSWETKVETKKEPQKKFDGVYKFENGETIGDGCNRNSILWKPHLYTISFRQLYLAKKCPKIRKYFANMVYMMKHHI